MLRPLIELFLAHRHSREPWNPRQMLLGRDRRIFQRVPMEMPCRINNPLFNQDAAATALNLSLGGIGMVAPVSWPEGSRIRVLLEEPALQVEGMIVFRMEASEQFRYGVKFHRLSLKNLVRLRRMLRRRYRGPLAVI